IMAVGPAIAEGHRRSAMDNTTGIVRLYSEQSTAELIRVLHEKGVEASTCSSTTPSDIPRLASSVREITTDTGGAGWRTQIDVSVRLSLSALPSSPAVWT